MRETAAQLSGGTPAELPNLVSIGTRRVTSVVQGPGGGRRHWGLWRGQGGIRHTGTGCVQWRVRGCSPDGPRIRLLFLWEGGSCAKKLRKNRWQTPARPVAPRPWDVRRAPGIRTAAGRGYRPRGRPVLSLESRERERPARCRPRVQPIGRSKVIQSRKRSLQLVALTPLALACMAMSAHAANRVNLHQPDVSGINSRYANASVAIGVSKQASVRHAEMLGLGPDSTLSVLRTSTTRDGVRNTRYQQQFRGVPVYGEHVVVSEDANGQVRALFGRKIEGLAAELPAVAPRVSSTQALASAKRAALGSRLLGMRVQAEKSRQVVFVGDDGRAHMAWQVSFFADSAGGGSPTSPLVIVDAASGAILKQFDALKNDEIGTGPGGNEKDRKSTRLKSRH